MAVGCSFSREPVPSAVGGRGSLSPPGSPHHIHPTAPSSATGEDETFDPRRPILAAEFPGVGPTWSGAEWGGLQRDPATLAQQRVGLIGPVNRGS